jgi:hypothetical protein
MNTSTSSLSEMINSSIVVLTKPSVSTFEQFERRGTLQTAMIYLAVAGVVGAVVGFLAGMLPGPPSPIVAAITGFINVFILFFLFTGTTYLVGKNQGGTGTFDEVAYTFSLFWVPLSILSAIPIIGICLSPVVLVAAIFFAYLAIQSSMNLGDTTKAAITLAVSAFVSVFAYVLLNIYIF